jgi:hypothetical protein
MKVEYTEWQRKTKVVDTDEFWLKWCNDEALKADAYWKECYDNGEPYCYGRNDIYLNLYYAETSKYQPYTQIIIPKEVWDVPNRIFAKLISFKI